MAATILPIQTPFCNVVLPLLPLRGRIYFPSNSIWTGPVTCFDAKEMTLPIWSLGLKKTGSFYCVLLVAIRHVQQCKLDYWIVRGHMKRKATWRTRMLQLSARTEVLRHVSKDILDPPVLVKYPSNTSKAVLLSPVQIPDPQTHDQWYGLCFGLVHYVAIHNHNTLFPLGMLNWWNIDLELQVANNEVAWK